MYESLLEKDLPNLNAQENAGWCLSMTQKVFRAPVAHPHATAAWFATKFKHETREMPNVPVPVWFKWINNIKGDPNYGVDQGHAVSWIPGRGFLSSPGRGFGSQWFDSIVSIEKYFGCTFRGWSQDINGKRVARPVSVPAPAPSKPAQQNTGQGSDYRTIVELAGYVSASDAAKRQNSNSRVPAGDYKVFNQADGMVNITRDVNQPGWWINPADNIAPAPAAPGFAVGDTVAPNSKQIQDYAGIQVYAWHDSYTITELIGDRAVLSVGGTIWAAMRTSDIHKV